MRLVQSRSGAVLKSKWPSWAPVPNKSTPVFVDVKQHSTNSTRAAQFREAGVSVSPVSRQTVSDVFWTGAENHGERGGGGGEVGSLIFSTVIRLTPPLDGQRVQPLIIVIIVNNRLRHCYYYKLLKYKSLNKTLYYYYLYHQVTTTKSPNSFAFYFNNACY